MNDPLLPVTSQAFCDELGSALGRIAHCVGQLSDEQVWWRPRADMNAVGNLVLHLAGNVKQLIVSSIGGAADDRDRPAEFAERGPIPAADLMKRLTDVVERAKSAIAAASPEELCRVRRVMNFDLTGLQCLVRSVAHFRGHTQEIIHQTRTILGDRYQFAGPR
jgi:hypothetical protein